LAIIIVIHIAAALKHHFFDKDNTLSRMLKGYLFNVFEKIFGFGIARVKGFNA